MSLLGWMAPVQSPKVQNQQAWVAAQGPRPQSLPHSTNRAIACTVPRNDPTSPCSQGPKLSISFFGSCASVDAPRSRSQLNPQAAWSLLADTVTLQSSASLLARFHYPYSIPPCCPLVFFRRRFRLLTSTFIEPYLLVCNPRPFLGSSYAQPLSRTIHPAAAWHHASRQTRLPRSLPPTPFEPLALPPSRYFR